MNTPRVNDPDTWLECVVEGCDTRIDPLEHKFRCARHRIVDVPRHLLTAQAEDEQ